MKYKYRKQSTNINIIPGRVQLTSIYVKNHKINVINIYAPTGEKKQDISEIQDKITEVLTNIKNEPIIVIGDLNFNTLQPETRKTKSWLNLLNTFGLFEKESNLPSYIRANKDKIDKTRLDHLFTNKFIKIKKEEIISNNYNDHLMLIFECKLKGINSWKRFIHNSDEIAQDLNACFESFNSIDELNDKLIQINKNIIEKSKKTYPTCNIFKDSKEILTLKSNLQKAIHRNDTIKMREIRQDMTETYKKDFDQYKRKFIDHVNSSNSNYLYKFDKWIRHNELDWNNLPNGINKEATQLFFEEKFTSKNPTSKFKAPKSTISQGPKQIHIEENDVITALNRMKSKSSGPDHINIEILKKSDPKLIAKTLQYCYSKKNIPNEWKKGYVKLIPKKTGLRTNKDFRPITIMNIMYRLLMNIINRKLKTWASKYINQRQQAFTSFREANKHCILIQALKKKYKKKGLFITNLDISGAYDSIEFPVMKLAMEHAKWPKHLQNFILNSYSENELQLEWNDLLNKPFTKTKGIPQGCPLAPLIYNLVTQLIIDKCIENWEIPKNISEINPNDIGMLNFADDMTIVNDNDKIQNKRLKQLNRWLIQLHLVINPSKSITTFYPESQKKTISINGNKIPFSKNQRILGCFLNDNTLLTEELYSRKSTMSQTLSLLPINNIEPSNLNKIINAKAISLITHLSRGNGLSDSIIREIDNRIRYKIRNKLKIHLKTSREYLYLPINVGGLNIPSAEHQTNKITIDTLLKYYYSNDSLISKAVKYSLKRSITCNKTTSLDIFEKFWDILYHNNITAQFMTHKITQLEKELMDLHKNEKTFNVWTDGSKTKDGTGFGMAISSDNITTRHSFNLNTHHSHNLAEIMAILTTIKMLPSNSNITIHSDSLISIQLLQNREYYGPLKAIQHEYLTTIKSKSLKVTLVKVEGHKDKGNIHVDKLAKKGCTCHNTITMYELLTKGQIVFTYNDKETTDIRKLLNKIYFEKNEQNMKKKNSKFKFIDHNLTHKYIHSKSITPTQKYSIWRNIHELHKTDINGKHPICDECQCEATIKHLSVKCPKLIDTRNWALNRIKELTKSKDPTFKISSKLDQSQVSIRYNSSVTKKILLGFTSNKSYIDKLTDIQATLAILNGKAYIRYMELQPQKGTTGTQ